MKVLKSGIVRIPFALSPIQKPALFSIHASFLRNDTQSAYQSSKWRIAADSAEMQTTESFSSNEDLTIVPQSLEWELDFSSRPLLDERKKKVWELLICDPERTFEYSQYFPNNKVNSAELKQAIENLLNREGSRLPRRVKFFRGQMKTIISRALNELEIPIVPTRRCFALTSVLSTFFVF